ncbi:MBL fold metallo-hydrolase [Gluconacetobacter sacchari]|uniref:MBL fold metallo-hydrolase n=1 Tax=Gluconacetobacter sacchari TaxID=92759 RepID=A0A7W4NSZ9_9PROT|nr:MBL fold metallo-hydrolase [Gluconacetobacter sacchari]MBB2161760.1 MBL fold metallo-hydrolase [Gluconacetobacter sacchari]
MNGSVLTLCDGSFQMPLALFSPHPAIASLAEKIGRAITVPVQCHLVREEAGFLLVDAGGGSLMGAGFGAMAERLAQRHIRPCAIESIYLTHLHGDHIGGLIGPDDAAAFPRARLHLSRMEYEFWTSYADAGSHAAIARDARRILRVWAGRITLLEPGESAGPMTCLPLPGHTPGHSGWRYGDRTIFAGDVAHHALQLTYPNIETQWDMSPADARTSRHDVLYCMRGYNMRAFFSHVHSHP